MTYATQAAKVGRKPFLFAEIDLDACSLTYGDSPCMAAIGVSGPDRCCNSFRTCQDRGAFSRVVKTFRFCMDGQQLAGDVMASLDAIPSIRSISQEASRLDPSKPLGIRAGVQIVLSDAPHNDRGVDPYASLRSYDPEERGTFWSKLAARWPYHEGRPLRVYSGFLSDDGEVLSENFRESAFIIQKIDGPDASGKVTITGKDPLRLADADKVQYPAVSRGKLQTSVSDSSTSIIITATESAHLTAYGASGEFEMDGEIISFSSRTANAAGGIGYVSTFTCTRARRNTEAAAHDAGAKAQLCASWTLADPLDVISDLLQLAGVDASFLDLSGWADEADDWFPGVEVSCFQAGPAGVSKLVSELCESVGIFMWWDGREQLVKMRAIRPTLPEDLTEIGDDGHIVVGTTTEQTDAQKRLSQVWIYWDPIDQVKDLDKASNYRQSYIAADLSAESPESDGGLEYQSGRSRQIFARWLPSSDGTTAPQMANRLLNMYRDTPRTISFAVDAKDDELSIGADALVTSRLFVNEFGAEEPRVLLITEAKESVEGAPIPLKAFSLGSSRRYGRIAPDALAGTTHATATDEQRTKYVFVGNDADPSRMADGSLAYRIA